MRAPHKRLQQALHVIAAMIGQYLERTAAEQAVPPRIDVILWFDTEDYLLPADDDACLRLATMLRETFPRQIKVQTKLADNVPPIHADPGMMEQILVNLGRTPATKWNAVVPADAGGTHGRCRAERAQRGRDQTASARAVLRAAEQVEDGFDAE